MRKTTENFVLVEGEHYGDKYYTKNSLGNDDLEYLEDYKASAQVLLDFYSYVEKAGTEYGEADYEERKELWESYINNLVDVDTSEFKHEYSWIKDDTILNLLPWYNDDCPVNSINSVYFVLNGEIFEFDRSKDNSIAKEYVEKVISEF